MGLLELNDRRIADLMEAMPEKAFVLHWDGAVCKIVHAGRIARGVLDATAINGVSRWLADIGRQKNTTDRFQPLRAPDGLLQDYVLASRRDDIDERSAIWSGVLLSPGDEDDLALSRSGQTVDPIVWITDHDNRLVYGNKAFELTLGARIASDDADSLAALCARIRAGQGAPVLVDLDNAGADQRTKATFEATVAVDDDGAVGEGFAWYSARAADAEGLTPLRPDVQSIADGMSEFVSIHNAGGQPVFANRQLREFLGIETDDALAVHIPGADESHSQDYAFGAAVKRARQLGAPICVDIVAVDAADGKEVHRVTVIPLFSKTGSLYAVASFGSRISGIHSAADILSETRDRLSRIVDVLPDMLWLKDGSGRIMFNNPAMERFFNLAPGSAIGGSCEEFAPHELVQFADGLRKQAAATGEAAIGEIEVAFPGRTDTTIVEIRTVEVPGVGSAASNFLSIGRDRTTEHRLNEIRGRFETVVRSLPDMVWFVDNKGQFQLANPAFERFAGLSQTELFQTRPNSPERAVAASLMEAGEIDGETGAARIVEKTVQHPRTGVEVFFEVIKVAVRSRSGEVDGYLYIARDMTHRKSLELELRASKNELIKQAYSDPLTGLHNRRHYSEKIEEILAATSATHGLGALLMIDLDRFSAINDSVGHTAGDVLLMEMARRIRKVADGHGGYVARLNGDEFVVALQNVTGRDMVARVAERILTALSEPFFSGSWVLTVSGSIGIALFPEHAKRAEELLSYADNAMYEAKRGGQNTWRIFDESLIMQARERFELENDIRRGLSEGHFTSHFQAKIDLRTGEITGVEALMRWNHPERGTIPPAIFIPLAEETGLIVPLGEKILTDACHFARNWNDGSRKPIRVAVNLSPRQLMFDDFMPLLKACLSKTSCRPEWLELEITENILLSDEKRIDDLMHGLASLGVGISIDDFGTGYSAMSYLTRYPIETLKIDRSFVHDIVHTHKRAVLVKAIVSMARGLGMNTVAEGIESREEAVFMRDIGCNEGQGYLWHRPMPEDAFMDWARERQKNLAAE